MSIDRIREQLFPFLFEEVDMERQNMAITYGNDREMKALEVLARLCIKKSDGKRRKNTLVQLSETDKEQDERIPDYALSQAERILEQCCREGILVCLKEETNYPPLLSRIALAPEILFYRGTHPGEISTRAALSVVGSRKADRAGRALASQLASLSAAAGAVVVSGLAYGIDAAAHTGALQGGAGSLLPTIAVLGHGLAQPVYPASNRKLANNILEQGGCLLSHFLPDTPAFPSNFLNRNRIVAGLSMVTLIVQATSRSGSLSTARHARDEGREVFVVPGPFDSTLYEGSHELIRQGASLITTPMQLLQELREIYPDVSGSGDISGSQQGLEDVRFRGLYEAFKRSGQLSYEELQNIVSDEEVLGQCLLELELGGFIKRLPGMQFLRTG